MLEKHQSLQTTERENLNQIPPLGAQATPAKGEAEGCKSQSVWMTIGKQCPLII